MTETRCWKLGPLALMVAALGTSCAKASKQAPAASPPSEEAAPAHSEIDAFEHDLEVSETRLRAVLAQRTREDHDERQQQLGPRPESPSPATPPTAPGQAAPPPPPATAPAQDKAQEPQAESTAPVRVGSDCDLACRALASMRRAADGICGITGEHDPRCQSAQERVEAARQRVEGAGCKCL